MNKSKMSKTLFTIAILLFIFTIDVFGQGVIGVVEYIKAENPEEFLKVEEEWHPIYKNLFKREEMDGCAVYEVKYKTNEADYNYIKILWFDVFSKVSFRPNHNDFLEAYPNKTESDWKNLQKRTKEAYEVVKSGYFQMQATILNSTNGLDTAGSVYKITEFHIQPGKSKEYLSLIKDFYMPVYEEDVKNHHRTTWSLWAKWTGSFDTFEYTTADGYPSMDQIDEDRFAEYFHKVHPDKDLEEISKKMSELKVPVNWEMWITVFRILKQSK